MAQTTWALKPLGRMLLDVVVHQVGGDGLDALLGLHDVAGRAPLLLQGQDFRVRELLHQIVKRTVLALGDAPAAG